MPSRTGRIAILGVGAVLAVLCSLSIHVVMLQILGVPYPGNLPADGLARLPDRLLALFGAGGGHKSHLLHPHSNLCGGMTICSRV